MHACPGACARMHDLFLPGVRPYRCTYMWEMRGTMRGGHIHMFVLLYKSVVGGYVSTAYSSSGMYVCLYVRIYVRHKYTSIGGGGYVCIFVCKHILWYVVHIVLGISPPTCRLPACLPTHLPACLPAHRRQRAHRLCRQDRRDKPEQASKTP